MLIGWGEVKKNTLNRFAHCNLIIQNNNIEMNGVFASFDVRIIATLSLHS